MTSSRTLRRAALLGVAGVAIIGVAVPLATAGDDGPPAPGSSSSGDREPAASVSGSGSAQEAVPAPPVTQARQVGAVVPEPPTAIRLPDGTVVPVVAVSSRANGLLDVPEDIRVAGWWRGGARIGDPFGSTLVAGHVDSSTQGLGPFVALLSVRRGALVEVRTAGLHQTFRVTALQLVPQGTLPQHAWIYAPDGPRRLTLVTCAPPYVRADGGYQNLAVLTARPVGRPQPRGAR